MRKKKLLKCITAAAVAACAFFAAAPNMGVLTALASSEEVFITQEGNVIPTEVMGSSLLIEEELNSGKYENGINLINTMVGSSALTLYGETLTNSSTTAGEVSLTSVSPFTGSTYIHESRFENYELFNGVDVSKWQGKIDWAKLKAAGVDFAIVRVGHRSAKDGKIEEDIYYKENLANAIANGIDVGVYIYSQAITPEEAEEEAQFLIDRVKGYNVTLPLVIDYEAGYYTSSGKQVDGRMVKAYANGSLTKDKATDVIYAFCEKVEDAGYTPMLYANVYFMTTKLNGEEIGENYPVWLARYYNRAISDSSFVDEGNYSYWQYSSQGTISGIQSTYIDCDYLYKNFNINTKAPKVTGQTAHSVTLKWSSTEDAAGYRIYRLNESTGKYEYIGETTKRSYTDTGLKSATEYSYKVKAFWTLGGERHYAKASASVTTSTATKPVTGVTMTSNSASAIVLNWDAVSKAKGYRVYQYNAKTGTYKSLGTVFGKSNTTFKVAGLDSSTEYEVAVSAYLYYDDKAIFSEKSERFSGVTKPAQVGEVTTKNATSSSVTLSWKKQPGATGYQVYRYNTKTKKWDKVETVTKNSITEEGLLSATTYQYRIRAYKAFGGKNYFGAYSESYAATTAPGKVTGVKMVDNTNSSITLTWSRVERAMGYRIYRYNTDTKEYKKVGTCIGIDKRTFTDTKLDAVTAYKYIVVAFTKYNGIVFEGDASDVVKTVTKTDKPTGLKTFETSEDSITLTWNETYKATGYIIYRYNAKTKNFDRVGKVSGNTNLTFTDEGLSASTAYKYKICAYKSYNGKVYFSELSSAHNSSTAPAAVKNIKITGTSKKAVAFKWNKATGASGYYIYRYDEESEEFELIDELDDAAITSYRDSGLNSQTTYQYQVVPYRIYKTVLAEGTADITLEVTTK